tara:strand:- start:605 stop:1126 length:522 start_codon:yes stop_codon:yes gene_type:complete
LEIGIEFKLLNILLAEERMAKLVGIAITPKLLAPMQEIQQAIIEVDSGIQGDARGSKRNRQISILFEDDWIDACEEIGIKLPWTTRRANLFVSGIRAPKTPGLTFQINDVELVVAVETDPCDLMDKQFNGLQSALKPDWRGGVCCTVSKRGQISVGDEISFEIAETCLRTHQN